VAARAALAQLLADEHRMAEAEQEFRRALAVLPTYGVAAFGLAELYRSQQRHGEAIRVLADLLTVDPYRLDALVRLGELLVTAGRFDEARFAYERVLRFDPAHGAARAGLARVQRAWA
jgi:tetratricopeptide (TPR) repeat protein